MVMVVVNFPQTDLYRGPKKKKNDIKTAIIKGVSRSLNREKSFKDILEGLQRPFDVEKELLRHTR